MAGEISLWTASEGHTEVVDGRESWKQTGNAALDGLEDGCVEIIGIVPCAADSPETYLTTKLTPQTMPGGAKK